MSFSPRIRHLLVTLAIVTASVIQLARGYRPVIVIVAALTFLIAGNAVIYLSGSKQRELHRQQRRDYYAGNS